MALRNLCPFQPVNPNEAPDPDFRHVCCVFFRFRTFRVLLHLFEPFPQARAAKEQSGPNQDLLIV